jgi:hypothetical protein
MKEEAMKLYVGIIVASLFLVGFADAQTAIKTGPDGKKMVVKMDKKYSTCISEGKRMGYAADAAKRYCDGRPGLTR